MKNLETILAKVFITILNGIHGHDDNIFEYIQTKDIIDLCDELKLNDFKEKLLKYEKGYEEDDEKVFDEIYKVLYQ